LATNALYSVAMSTLLISHPAFLDHDTGEYHPERPDRLRALLGALEDPAFDGLKRSPALAHWTGSVRAVDWSLRSLIG